MTICRTCLNDKPSEGFYIKNKKTGRLHLECRECKKTRSKTTVGAKRQAKRKQNGDDTPYMPLDEYRQFIRRRSEERFGTRQYVSSQTKRELRWIKKTETEIRQLNRSDAPKDEWEKRCNSAASALNALPPPRVIRGEAKTTKYSTWKSAIRFQMRRLRTQRTPWEVRAENAITSLRKKRRRTEHKSLNS